MSTRRATTPRPARSGGPAARDAGAGRGAGPGRDAGAGRATGERLVYDVVVPTIGRPALARLLDALAACPAPRPRTVLVVDDRAGAAVEPLRLGAAAGFGLGSDRGGPADIALSVVVLRSGGRGPAAARNVGWRASEAAWVAFLDDDVVPDPDWTLRLRDDLRAAGPGVGGVQGRIRVPLPHDRRPTDWERNVAGLEGAQWATADLAYRRAALEQVGGFDERFRRNYREDADLGLRVVAAGWTIERGGRSTEHPVGPADRWTSLRLQRGNADDVLMRALHGPRWRERAGAPQGRLPRHAATAAAGVTALALFAAGLRRPAGRVGRVSAVTNLRKPAGAAAAVAWAAGTAELAWTRIAPGPRTPEETATMLATSAAIPFAATAWHLRGRARWRRAAIGSWRGSDDRDVEDRMGTRLDAPPTAGVARTASDERARPAAILFDRDGTLVVDVPYNGDPARVAPMPGAVEALALLRAAGVPTAVVSNQSGIARGLLSPEQVAAVNARADELLGGVGPWLHCPHGPGDGCACRKPAPGLVLAAAEALGVDPAACVLIGDIGADVDAARAAGARGVLVPTPRTLREEVDAAREVAPDLLAAVRLALGDAAPSTRAHAASVPAAEEARA